MDRDHKPRQPVEETGMQDIAGKERGQGAEEHLEERRSFPLQFHAFGGECAITVDLDDMVLLAGIGEMEQIAFERPEGRVFVRLEGFVDEVGAPLAFSPAKESQLPIGIPAAMADPSAAVMAKAIHPIAIFGKAAFFLE
jgi:hypothetical protein